MHILASNIQIVLSLETQVEKRPAWVLPGFKYCLYWLSFAQHCLQRQCAKRFVPLGNGQPRNLTKLSKMLFLWQFLKYLLPFIITWIPCPWWYKLGLWQSTELPSVPTSPPAECAVLCALVTLCWVWGHRIKANTFCLPWLWCYLPGRALALLCMPESCRAPLAARASSVSSTAPLRCRDAVQTSPSKKVWGKENIQEMYFPSEIFTLQWYCRA